MLFKTVCQNVNITTVFSENIYSFFRGLCVEESEGYVFQMQIWPISEHEDEEPNAKIKNIHQCFRQEYITKYPALHSSPKGPLFGHITVRKSVFSNVHGRKIDCKKPIARPDSRISGKAVGNQFLAGSLSRK